MAIVRRKMTEMKNGDVRYISLVDRAATRMPFRILKREKDTDGVDLMKLFAKKSDKKQPELAALVVCNQEPEVMQAVRQSIAKAGFQTEQAQKGDDHTTLFAQSEFPKNPVLIRLSEEMVAVTKGFSSYMDEDDGDFAEKATAQGFYSGLDGAMDVFSREFQTILMDSEEPAEVSTKVKKLVGDFGNYVQSLVETLPQGAFKADYAVREVLKKKEELVSQAKKVDGATLNGLDELLAQAPKNIAENEWGKMSPIDKITWYKDWFANNNTPTADMTAKCEKCPGDHATADHDKFTKKDEGNGMTTDGDTDMETEKATKKLENTLLSAITGLKDEFTKQIGEVTTKFESALADQKKVVDEAVKKSEDAAKKLEGVTLAPATPADTPTLGGGNARKSDSDPRSGCFDTAFIPSLRKKRGN